MKFVAVAALVLMVALIGCSRPAEAPTPTQDVDTAVQTAMADSSPPPPTLTPDKDTVIKAGYGGNDGAVIPPIPNLSLRPRPCPSTWANQSVLQDSPKVVKCDFPTCHEAWRFPDNNVIPG